MAETTLTRRPHQWRRRLLPTQPRGGVSVLLRSIAAIAGGVLVALAFPPVAVWPLAPVGAAIIALATYRQRARTGALLGFLAGLGLFLPLLSWVHVIMTAAWIGLALAQAAYLIPLGAGLALVTRLPGWPVWSAALWVADEALRGRFPFGGFTWGRLAFSQGHSGFTPYAMTGGAPFVTFLVALAAGLAAWAVVTVVTVTRGRSTDRHHRAPIAAAAVAALAALAIPTLGYAVPLQTGGTPVTVAAVQGDVPRAGLNAFHQRRAVLNNHVGATNQLAARVAAGAAPQPDFVVWPENSSDIDPYTHVAAHNLIDQAVSNIGVPTLIGAVVADHDSPQVWNRGIVWNPTTGPGETYTKRHLVPFCEYVPFRHVLTSYVDLIEQHCWVTMTPGTEPDLLTIGGVKIADTICFDVAYGDVVRSAVRAGGKLIVVQTNNATYGHTSQPEQQLAIERFRAVEHGRAVVVAATSGISAIISPTGELLQTSEPFTRQVLIGDVPLRDTLTLSDELGAAPEWILTGIGILAAVAAIGLSIANRRTYGRKEAAHG